MATSFFMYIYIYMSLFQACAFLTKLFESLTLDLKTVIGYLNSIKFSGWPGCSLPEPFWSRGVTFPRPNHMPAPQTHLRIVSNSLGGWSTDHRIQNTINTCWTMEQHPKAITYMYNIINSSIHGTKKHAKQSPWYPQNTHLRKIWTRLVQQQTMKDGFKYHPIPRHTHQQR